MRSPLDGVTGCRMLTHWTIANTKAVIVYVENVRFLACVPDVGGIIVILYCGIVVSPGDY